MAEYPTLYQWAGGHDAFDRMIDAFYDRVERDDVSWPDHLFVFDPCPELSVSTEITPGAGQFLPVLRV